MKPQPHIAALLFAALLSPASAADATAWKFQFGTEHAAAGLVAVSPSAVYSAAAGYGFEPGAAVSAAGGAAVTSAQPFFFSVKVPEGNYRVTVTLGAPDAASVTTVKAETRRLLLERVRTEAGRLVQRTFTVNVRGPKISTGGEVNLDSREMDLTTHVAISKSWDDKLTLEFSDEHPALAALDIQKVDNAVTFFITGDSTVTDQPGWPSGSWGQMATRWFKPEVAVANHAESGETLKGFLKERRWDKLLDQAKPGDYVIIEFGTNDSKNHGPQNIYPNQDFSETFAPAETTYKELLRRFVADVQKRGAHPIIASPSARRGETKHPTSLQPWATAAMEVAKELNVPGIDLNSMGVRINVALGADAAAQFADGTHHREYGAYLQSKCIVLGIQQANLPLARSIVDDFKFDPDHPEPLPAQYDLPPDPNSGRGGGRAGGARGPGGRGAGGASPETATQPKQ
jgi:lysophospholipase L1-like esterase